MSSIAEQVGRVVGGRYRLLAAVGSGASAQVFAAEDTRLARRVAVKLLHPGLAGEARFLRKFEAEARLAASLNHRNVLHVYDWGDESGAPYLVFEFLGGGSLRGMLDDGHLLTPGQAAALGAEAARGLAYAHRRGLVHRDVKPANLLFDEDGRLLVADFGLAQALAEAALTEPLGTVLGTVRYASPEQVEGRRVDDRTDVYSLALTLYEAVTGRVPFLGDTPAATLISRVGAVLPRAPELGPLAPVLAQAAISEPLARLDAAALASELEEVAAELAPIAPLPLARLTVAFRPPVADRDPTGRIELGDAAPGSSLSALVASTDAAYLTAVSPGLGRELMAEPVDWLEELPWPDGRSKVDGARAATTEAPAASAAQAGSAATLAGRFDPAAAGSSVHERGGPPRRRRGRTAAKWGSVALAVLLVIAGVGVGIARFAVYDHVVPKLVGTQLARAAKAVQSSGLRLVVTSRRYDLALGSGAVISQSPRPSTREAAGTRVDVVVSRGAPPVPVPDVANLTAADARSALRADHLRAVFAPPSYSETVRAGLVLNAAPASGTALWGSDVTVVISKGPAPRKIPPLVGSALASAESALQALRLVPVPTPVHSLQYGIDQVTSISPVAGHLVKRGSDVIVDYSIGPPMVTIPSSIYFDSISAATQVLEQLGLHVRTFGPPFATNVYTSSPAPGRTVEVGSTVLLYTI